MAREEPDVIAARIVGPCRCHPAFKDRGLEDPECAWCNYSEDIAEAILAERDRLAARVAALEGRLAWSSDLRHCVARLAALRGKSMSAVQCEAYRMPFTSEVADANASYAATWRAIDELFKLEPTP